MMAGPVVLYIGLAHLVSVGASTNVHYWQLSSLSHHGSLPWLWLDRPVS